ncbi:P68 family surface lipoprotein [[Mycoplasma] collis]|uniref:P68 family surface lipoprotein n=1 Tax=[Mycoplasma] collis TaxID=2127 RepID=UPI00051B021C|nr:P80 family lipoprotein [[Mycoplasma] collis]
MKFKKAKKKLLYSGLLLASAATLTSVISCGGAGRYDQTNDQKLVIASTFSSSGDTKKALDKIVEKWNKHVEALKDDKTLMKVEIESLSGGYSGLTETLNQKLNVRSKDSLYNIMFNYPNVVGLLNRYDMKLNLAGTTEEEKEVGLLKTIKDNYDENVLFGNTGVDKIAKDKEEDTLWLIPSNSSTEILSINSSVMSYILDEAVKTGEATIKAEDKTFFENIKTKGAKDKETVKKIWKEYVSNADALKGYEFKKSALESYEGIFELSKRIKKAFPKASEGGADSKADNVLGLDALANTVYSMMSSILNKNSSDLIYNDETKKFYEDWYKESENSESKKIYENFNNEIFKKIFELLETQTLFLKTAGDYSSNRFKTHRLLFQISSSTGYKHNYVETDVEGWNYELKKDGKVTDFSSSNLEKKSLSKIKKPTDDEIEKGIVLKYIVESGDKKHENVVYEEKFDFNTIKKDDKNTKYNKKFSLELSNDNKTSFMKFLNEKTNYNTAKADEEINLYLSTDSTLLNFFDEIIGEKAKEEKKNENKDWTDDISLLSKDGKNKVVFIHSKFVNSTTTHPRFNLKLEKPNPTKTLQKEEIIALEAPYYAKNDQVGNDNIIKNITLQGPSIFGMHSNKEENLATLKFLKWMLTDKYDWSKDDKDFKENNKKITEKMTAMNYFVRKSGYIPLSADRPKVEIKQLTGAESFATIGKQMFEKAFKDPSKYRLNQDAVEVRADAFRSAIDDSFADLKNRLDSTIDSNETKEVKDSKIKEEGKFKEFLKKFKLKLGTRFK